MGTARGDTTSRSGVGFALAIQSISPTWESVTLSIVNKPILSTLAVTPGGNISHNRFMGQPPCRGWVAYRTFNCIGIGHPGMVE